MRALNGAHFVICTYYLIVATQVAADWLVECGVCKCKWNSGKKTADCRNVSLRAVPNDLSSELQVLDISQNSIGDLRNSDFMSADLQNLHKLFARNCSLRTISRDSLRGLEILIELDLSFNLIRVLPRGLFTSLIKIRALILNSNRIERLDDGLFRNLKYLHKIELNDNLISRIETKPFINLPLLTQIHLDANKLTVLRKEIFLNLEKLASLSLKLNPWNCTCELKAFRDFTLQRNLYTPPTDCFYPPSLRETLWTDVSAEEFACKPEIVYPERSITITSSSENVTLSCHIHATTNTEVAWTFNKHPFSQHPTRMFIKNAKEQNAADATEIVTSDLTIVGVRQADRGTYTCVAQNRGGRAEANIVLVIDDNGGGGGFIASNLLVILCLVAVGLLISSVVIMAITCCYCRKFKKLTKQDLNNKSKFDAVKLNSFTNTGVGTSNGMPFEMQKQSSTEFSQQDKSEFSMGDCTDSKHCLLNERLTEIAGEAGKEAANNGVGMLLTPAKNTNYYDQRDLSLPPDLLPYRKKVQQTSAVITNVAGCQDGTGNFESGSYVTFKDLSPAFDAGCTFNPKYSDSDVGASPSTTTVGVCMTNGQYESPILSKDSDNLLKPRQSIVRASPSFSFLSNNYQNTHFL